MGEADDFFNQLLRIPLRIEKDMTQAFDAGQHDREGKLQHDGAEGSAKNDHGGGRLDDLGEFSALDHQAGQNPSDGKQQSTPTTLVQVQALLLLGFRRFHVLFPLLRFLLFLQLLRLRKLFRWIL